ncbi:tetratricopeptide repeat protein [Sporomusa aerivorans]|uniref:tetratricopeptide repeat protein n=1 Tax=Sporomusa aerivorans TaxID=204936 RepID=UPI00352A5AD9
MQGSRYWHTALVLSMVIHGLVLAGAGSAITSDGTAAATREEYMTMDLISVTEQSPGSVIEPAAAAPEFTDSPPPVPADVKEKPLPMQSPAKSAEETHTPKVGALQPVMGEAAQKAVPGQLLLHYDKNQLALALAQYNQALRLNPRSAFASSNRGQVYFDMGDFDKALADFSQALALNPRLAAAYIGRGFVYIKKGQWQPAMNDFDQAVGLAPESALSYYGRALCYTAVNEKQKAGRDFQFFLQYATPDYNRLILAAHQITAAWEHPPGIPDSSHKTPESEK